MEVLMNHVGPGKEFELGMDSWECGGKQVETMCFLSGPHTLREFYQRSFAEHADKEFIVYGDERYTYAQVEQIIKTLAHSLVEQLGVKQGDRVAISMRNFPEYCFTFIAVTWLGAIIVPLNSWWKTEELAYGLTDSGSKVLVCDTERFGRIEPKLNELKLQVVITRPENDSHKKHNIKVFEELMSDESKLSPAAYHSHTDHPACIMYTSGTTGHPKGVVQTHRGVTNQLRMAILARKINQIAFPPTGNEPQSCIVCPVPLFHVTATHHVFLSSFVVGRKMVLMYKWDAGEALKIIEKEKPDSWTGVPTMVQDLMEHPDFEKTDTSSLKTVGGGGAPTPKSQVERVGEKFKNGAPQQGYGLTETNGAISTIAGEEYVKNPGSCGKPFPIVEIAVVDPDDPSGKLLPAGQKGEILMKSPLIMKEYWNNRDKTDEAIISLPDNGHGWFRSGDIGIVNEDGYIFIMDRAKDIIIRGGENISCAEVESAAFENPKVFECAAFGIKDERLGEVVGLMVVPKAGESTTQAEILETVKPRLAAFKVPQQHHIFFQSDPLPRGATGKTLKRTIRDRINAKLESKSKL
eukprot:CAMPEP_0204838622 /NCGR_PEP_ID=MMETSP1346-20131115/31368_1 /ASSEMBLY_ACC=CAM_ASM_000771 /TAXON_ID=215587 /ORGANISM="Aplanochytrium stocchinoi, Strain GSBS06" /LENGTH=577 /DNA_ID=CAMNT_0051974783 /DNA_START=115 /DNA_END=1848 /DNA_ORIENTATION=-